MSGTLHHINLSSPTSRQESILTRDDRSADANIDRKCIHDIANNGIGEIEVQNVPAATALMTEGKLRTGRAFGRDDRCADADVDRECVHDLANNGIGEIEVQASTTNTIPNH
jgi:hypothetical protein